MPDASAGLTLLLGAPEADRRDLLQALCGRLPGVTVAALDTAGTADALGAALRSRHYDACLLDRALYDDLWHARTAVLVLLPEDRPDEAERLMVQGAADCLAWPGLDAPGLARVLRAALARRRAAAAHPRVTAIYHALVENAQDVITVLDRDAGVRFVSPSVERVLGLRPEEMEGHSAFERLHPEDAPRVRHLFEEGILQPGFSATLAYRLRRRDGSWCTLESRAKNLLDDPVVAGIIVNSRDITDRQQAETAVEQLKAFYEQILNDLPADLSVLDPQGRILFLNAASVRDPEMRQWLLGRTGFDYCHRRGLDTAIAHRRQHVIEQAVAERRIIRFEETIRTADGDERHILRMASPVVGADGAVQQVIGYGLDITELKRQEAELTRSREQLRRLALHLQSVREEERTRIAREVHDVLGQALTALRMDVAWAERLMPEMPAELRERFDSMKELLDHTVQVVRRIASDLRPGILDDLGLAAALEWEAQQFDRRTGIACAFTDRTGALTLDRDRATALFRIFQEILTNVARHAEAAHVTIRLTRRADALELQVQDDGRGIRPEEIARPSSLGLLGMRERVTPWGGHVHLEGRPGEGTRVTVTLPLARPDAPPSGAPARVRRS